MSKKAHNRRELAGQQFGLLEVLYAGKTIRNNGRCRSTWVCRCACGNVVTVKTDALICGSTKSCGCLKHEPAPNRLHLEGQRFGKLVVVEEAGKIGRGDTAWLCHCDCGKESIVKTVYLRSGSTKSCGCLMIEMAKNQIPNMIAINSKYTEIEAAARSVWFRYLRYDKCTMKNPTISFEDFYRLTQQNCHYCNIVPSNEQWKYNREHIFVYSGIDRIDSNKDHSIENCVPACKICNGAKSGMSLLEFKDWMIRIYNHAPNRIGMEECRQLSSLIDINPLIVQKSLLSTVKSRMNGIYDDGSLSIEQFYRLTQLNCYYCGIAPFTVYKKILIYNGLDRISSDLNHSWDNIVPSCWHCNRAKKERSLKEFDSYVERAYTHYIKTKWTIKKPNTI